MHNLKVVALAGGVGGARLTHGLARILPPKNLQVIVNTGDDFEHLGLTICPDLDTVLYTLAEVANPETGWGVQGESFNCLDAVARLGGPTWFALGDRDLATHLLRTQWLREGLRLTEVMGRLADALGVPQAVLPMSDQPFRTHVLTADGDLPFQEYFVHRQWQPVVHGFRWEGAAQPTSEVMDALQGADLIVICPSNPFVSIDPILKLPGVRAAVASQTVVAVSPILGGKAVKGPAAKMYRELGVTPSALAVAEHYQDFLTGFVLDVVDEQLSPAIQKLGMAACVMPTLMLEVMARVRVAKGVLSFGKALHSGGKFGDTTINT